MGIDGISAKALQGGRMDSLGAFSATVFADITPDMRIYIEDAFGPLAVIYRVPDADAAVALANNSQCGLGGSVSAEDLDEARRVALQLDSGGVGINTFLGAPHRGSVRRRQTVRGRPRMRPVRHEEFANIKTYRIG
jgi:succinate-semialdehyde dehydrogenase/glutarate-semialdehyde dehydrogenase